MRTPTDDSRPERLIAVEMATSRVSAWQHDTEVREEEERARASILASVPLDLHCKGFGDVSTPSETPPWKCQGIQTEWQASNLPRKDVYGHVAAWLAVAATTLSQQANDFFQIN